MDKNIKKNIEKIILSSSKVFIIGHNEPDFDAIASAIGLQILGTFLKKKSYIVVDDAILAPSISKIIDTTYKKNNIINKNKCIRLIDDNSTLIMTDVNKENMISLQNEINKFRNIIIIDHHKESDKTVATKYKFIDISKSSASEIVTELLMSYKNIHLDKLVANYLLAGIVLDTNRFKKNTSENTLNISRKLIGSGADNSFVQDLFLSEFETDKKISNLVFSNTIFRTFASGVLENKNIAFVLNRESPKTIYKREEIAQAADKLLKYKVDASFALGHINDFEITVSGRSKSDIDVADILSTIKEIDGGGNPTSAGARAKDLNINDVEDLLVERTESYLKEKNDHSYVLKKNKKY